MDGMARYGDHDRRPMRLRELGRQMRVCGVGSSPDHAYARPGPQSRSTGLLSPLARCVPVPSGLRLKKLDSPRSVADWETGRPVLSGAQCRRLSPGYRRSSRWLRSRGGRRDPQASCLTPLLEDPRGRACATWDQWSVPSLARGA